MNALMMNLQVRHFSRSETIAHELDEAEEIMFVFEGKYDVGYEVNKKKSFRAQFSQSTIIGLFQLCFG